MLKPDYRPRVDRLEPHAAGVGGFALTLTHEMANDDRLEPGKGKAAARDFEPGVMSVSNQLAAGEVQIGVCVAGNGEPDHD